MPNFAKVAGPLHALIKKDVPYLWTPQCQHSFDTLKELLTAPVLLFPQFDKPFILETDASGLGLGAVLAQRQEDGVVQPIAYASRSLQIHERNYGITELEGLGVVWAVRHFRPYLYGHPCDVYTDHSALTSHFVAKHPTAVWEVGPVGNGHSGDGHLDTPPHRAQQCQCRRSVEIAISRPGKPLCRRDARSCSCR